MNADVIVIGAGLAGIMCAGAACGRGARVLLLTRKTIGLASNSAISNGVLAGPTGTYDSETYIRDTLQIGKHLNSRAHVEAAARGIGDATDFLREAGCVLDERHGTISVRPERPDLIPGVTLMRAAAGQLKGLPGLTVRTGITVTDILAHGGRACGVKGADAAGRPVNGFAPAVVLAVGGAGAVYLRNDNQKRALGQGYAMALRAGLELRDLEFVQFYPFIHAEHGIPAMLVYPPVPREARLIDGAGNDIAARYGLGNLNDLILKKRDAISALLNEVMRDGPIYMDYRDVPSREWSRPPLGMLRKYKFDFRNKPFAVAPGVHFFMGGIKTDPQTRTELPGLFACGESAWGLHGANRRGGNALTECLVFGRIAGERAAEWGRSHPLAKTVREENIPPDTFDSSKTNCLPLLRQYGRRMREIAWHHAGIRRSEGELEAGLASLRNVEQQIRAVEPASAAGSIKKGELLGACLVLRAIFAASLARKETVGSFNRKDYPEDKAHSAYGNSRIRYDAAEDKMIVTFSGRSGVAEAT